MLTRDDIFMIIFNNKHIKVALNKLPVRFREEMKSSLYFIIHDLNKDKMIEISKSETDAVKYITMIITFQKRYKYSKFHKEMQIGKTYHYDNLDFLTTNEFEEEIDNEKLTKDVTNILDNIYPTINITLPLLRYFYNEYQKKLFKMYYFDKLKLKEISTLTDIKVGAISRSIVSTKKRIKKRLKNDYNYSIKLN